MSKGEMSLEVTYVLPLVYEWNSQSPEKLYGLTKVAQSDCTAKKKKKKKPKTINHNDLLPLFQESVQQ